MKARPQKYLDKLFFFLRRQTDELATCRVSLGEGSLGEAQPSASGSVRSSQGQLKGKRSCGEADWGSNTAFFHRRTQTYSGSWSFKELKEHLTDQIFQTYFKYIVLYSIQKQIPVLYRTIFIHISRGKCTNLVHQV